MRTSPSVESGPMRAPHKTTGPDCLPLEANCQELALPGGEPAGGASTGYKSNALADEVAIRKVHQGTFSPWTASNSLPGVTLASAVSRGPQPSEHVDAPTREAADTSAEPRRRRHDTRGKRWQ